MCSFLNTHMTLWKGMKRFHTGYFMYYRDSNIHSALHSAHAHKVLYLQCVRTCKAVIPHYWFCIQCMHLVHSGHPSTITATACSIPHTDSTTTQSSTVRVRYPPTCNAGCAWLAWACRGVDHSRTNPSVSCNCWRLTRELGDISR